MKLSLLTALITLLAQDTQAQLLYPEVKKITQVETRFGTVITDSYKWMENSSDPDLWSWIEEQKKLTNDYLDGTTIESFRARILEVRKTAEEQKKLTDKASPSADEGMRPRFIKWKSSDLKALDFKKESNLYVIQEKSVHNGDLKRLIISSKADNKVADILLVKFYTFITWADDNSFYYVSDLDERIGGGKTALFKHTVGELQSEDQVLLTGKTSYSSLTIHQVGERFFADVDGSIGSLQLETGKMTNRLSLKGEIVELTDAPQVEATIRSFETANFGELQKLRLRDGSRRVIMQEQDFVVAGAKKLTDEATLVIGLKDSANVAGILGSDGKLTMIDLKDGTIEFVSFKEGVLKLGHETFFSPKKIYSFELTSGKLTALVSQDFGTEIEAEKIHFRASNGQMAALWVMKKKGVKLHSKTAMILYGYGGFKASITPAFGIYESLAWMERGGAFAVATIPGSLDYGMSWYELSRNAGRTHSWDSFALAAEELFARGWTSKDHIGLLGASNGGTLVAGTLQRHAEKFKAAVPLVGVMDLINYNLFTAGKYWMNDFGNPFVENEFKAIYPLSPYHHISQRHYPAVLVMTAEFDDRVVPMHSYKYVARLQEMNTSDAPILLYNKEWGGHARASGSPRESSRYVAAYYTFFAQQLGL